MQPLKLLIALLALALVAVTAFADDGKQGHGDKLSDFDARVIHTMGKEGHGGHGVVCYDANHEIDTVTLYDLWEGKSVYGLVPLESDKTWEAIIDDVTKKILADNSTWWGVVDRTRAVKRALKFLGANEQLPEIDDEDEIVLPRGCEKRTIASYLNDDLILIDSLYWEKLSETGKAALILHEAWYRELRELDGITGSRRVRHLNAHVLATDTFEDPFEWVYSSTKYICRDANDSRLNWFLLEFTEEDGREVTRARFLRLNGESQIMRRMSQAFDRVEIPIPGTPGARTRTYGFFETESLFEGKQTIEFSAVASGNEWQMNVWIPTHDHRGRIHYDNIVCKP